MSGYESYNGGYDEKRGYNAGYGNGGYDQKQHSHVDEDAFGPKSGSSIVSAFDAFRRSPRGGNSRPGLWTHG
jgi:hypothetical protein